MSEFDLPIRENKMLRQVGFWRVILEDFQRHLYLSTAGFQTLFVHRVGVYATTLPPIVRLPLDIFYYFGWRFCRNFYGIEVRRTASLGRRFKIAHQHGIIIHHHLQTGENCTIRQGVTLGKATEWIEGEGPIIGDNVSFGVGSVVLGNVKIGSNVTVGPNCVVSMDIPSGCTLFVPPPRVLPKATPL